VKSPVGESVAERNGREKGRVIVKSPVGESVAERNGREKGRVIERMGKEGGSQNQSR
jgi:hypothetical protein